MQESGDRIAFCRSGKRIAVGCEDGSVVVMEGSNFETRFKLEGHKAAIAWCCFLPDGNLLTGESTNHITKRWSMETHSEIPTGEDFPYFAQTPVVDGNCIVGIHWNSYFPLKVFFYDVVQDKIVKAFHIATRHDAFLSGSGGLVALLWSEALFWTLSG